MLAVVALLLYYVFLPSLLRNSVVPVFKGTLAPLFRRPRINGAVPNEEGQENKGNILIQFEAQAHTFGKAFKGLAGISLGSFVNLMAASQNIYTMDVKKKLMRTRLASFWALEES